MYAIILTYYKKHKRMCTKLLHLFLKGQLSNYLQIIGERSYLNFFLFCTLLCLKFNQDYFDLEY